MMTSAPITPGIQPHNVKMNIMIMEPQPLSITASGGNKMDRMTLKMLINNYLNNKYEKLYNCYIFNAFLSVL